MSKKSIVLLKLVFEYLQEDTLWALAISYFLNIQLENMKYTNLISTTFSNHCINSINCQIRFFLRYVIPISYIFYTNETKCKDEIMSCFHIIRFTQLCNIMSQIPNVWGKAESVKLCNAWMKYHLYTIIQQQNHRNAS